MTTALRALLDHAERQRDASLSALLQSEEGTRRLHVQARQLTAYRDEYRSRSPAAGGRSAPIELLRGHQGFMLRLEQALAQQQSQQRAAEARGQALRAELLAHETRVASVRKLLERRDESTRRAAHRLEQRRTDEAGALRRRGGIAASQWGQGLDALSC